MNLRPRGDGLVVEPFEQEVLADHAILLLETARKKPTQGKVLVISSGARNEDGTRIALDVSKGDTMLYPAYAGSEIKIEDGRSNWLRPCTPAVFTMRLNDLSNTGKIRATKDAIQGEGKSEGRYNMHFRRILN